MLKSGLCLKSCYIPSSLKGSNKIAPMILKMTANVNPRIWKGNKSNQKKINKKKTPMANGQHKENSIKKSNRAIMNFIVVSFIAF